VSLNLQRSEGWVTGIEAAPCPICHKPDYGLVVGEMAHSMPVELVRPAQNGGWNVEIGRAVAVG
jgi:hypothetical protein